MRLFLLLLLIPLFSHAQFYNKKIGEVTGLVKFSVWEEDTLGNVLDGNKEVLFKHNY